MEKISYQGQEIRRWDVGPSTFLASPEKGALLMNWHLNMGDGSVRDVTITNRLMKVDFGRAWWHSHFSFAGKCFHNKEAEKWCQIPQPGQYAFARVCKGC